jgi:hypothetical protein
MSPETGFLQSRDVIPAKAGIHFAFALMTTGAAETFGTVGRAKQSKSKMDPSFRWDDGQVAGRSGALVGMTSDQAFRGEPDR